MHAKLLKRQVHLAVTVYLQERSSLSTACCRLFAEPLPFSPAMRRSVAKTPRAVKGAGFARVVCNRQSNEHHMQSRPHSCAMRASPVDTCQAW